MKSLPFLFTQLLIFWPYTHNVYTGDYFRKNCGWLVKYLPLWHTYTRHSWLSLLLYPPEEFNDKILSPELGDSELQRLHGEVVHIYETYCLDESIDKISFDKFIVEEIRNSKRTRCSLPNCQCSCESLHSKEATLKEVEKNLWLCQYWFHEGSQLPTVQHKWKTKAFMSLIKKTKQLSCIMGM